MVSCRGGEVGSSALVLSIGVGRGQYFGCSASVAFVRVFLFVSGECLARFWRWSVGPKWPACQFQGVTYGDQPGVPGCIQ